MKGELLPYCQKVASPKIASRSLPYLNAGSTKRIVNNHIASVGMPSQGPHVYPDQHQISASKKYPDNLGSRDSRDHLFKQIQEHMQPADDPVISESLKNALGKAQSQVIYSR